MSRTVALKDNELGWPNPETRNSIVDNLEDAAKCLEAIPKRISGRDRFSNYWNQQAYFRRASGIRELKKWVLLPQAETRDNLERELRRRLQLVAIGDWDGLPEAAMAQDTPISWWRRIFILIRSIVIAASLPVGVVIFGNALPQEFKASAYGVAWIWGVVGLFSVLDPHFGEKLSGLKDLSSFFPIGGKSKER